MTQDTFGILPLCYTCMKHSADLSLGILILQFDGLFFSYYSVKYDSKTPFKTNIGLPHLRNLLFDFSCKVQDTFIVKTTRLAQSYVTIWVVLNCLST